MKDPSVLSHPPSKFPESAPAASYIVVLILSTSYHEILLFSSCSYITTTYQWPNHTKVGSYAPVDYYGNRMNISSWQRSGTNNFLFGACAYGRFLFVEYVEYLLRKMTNFLP